MRVRLEEAHDQVHSEDDIYANIHSNKRIIIKEISCLVSERQDEWHHDAVIDNYQASKQLKLEHIPIHTRYNTLALVRSSLDKALHILNSLLSKHHIILIEVLFLLLIVLIFLLFHFECPHEQIAFLGPSLILHLDQVMCLIVDFHLFNLKPIVVLKHPFKSFAYSSLAQIAHYFLSHALVQLHLLFAGSWLGFVYCFEGALVFETECGLF